MKTTTINFKARLIYFIILLIPFLFNSTKASATHIVGATLNYEYISGNRYKLSVRLYRDCRTSTPPLPVPAEKQIRVNVRRSDGKIFELNINQTSKINLPLPLPDTCAQRPKVDVCVEEYLYQAEFNIFESGFDHHLFFSLCCRNSTITNLAPEQQTETIYTKIPARDDITNQANARFINPPPSYVCGGRPVTISHAATDPDGDELSYSLYTPNAGPQRTIQDKKYVPTVTNGYPNFVPVTYSTVSGFKFNGLSPMNAIEKIDSTNGDLSFTANTYGQFVVGVKVKEKRNGQVISETLRDYQFNIVRCPPPAKSVLALTDVCNSLRISPSNSGIDYNETTFLWNFGESTKAPKDTSHKRNPSYTYSKAGTYTIKLIVNPGTSCSDSSSNTIKVAQLKAGFISSRDTCAGFPVNFTDKSTSSSNTPITSRRWNFADGTPISTETNPTHIFQAGGSYNIRMTVSNSLGCKDSVVNVVKIIQEKPDAVAGQNDTLCKNNPTAQLKGIVTNAGGGIWKGGAGTFNPNRETLDAKYTPATGEVTAGFVDLKLVTTLNGKCGSDSTGIKILFTDPPTITPAILPYAPICGNNPTLDLRGRVLPPNRGFGIKWTGSGGKFVSNNPDPTTDPLAVYELSAAELESGKVNLSITSTNNGKCLPATAKTTVAINPPPVISAGNDTVICVNAPEVNLRGSVSVPSRVLWSTVVGDGTFTGGNTSLNSIYSPGPSDKTKGLVEVIFSTNEVPGFSYPQNCAKVRDTMYIKILPAAIVNAGSDITVCTNNPVVKLSGSVASTGGSKGIWSGGKGSFAPDHSSLNISYTPTKEEIDSKSIVLFLTSNNNDKCAKVTDSVRISFSPSPIVKAGIPGNYCKNNTSIKLNGAVSAGSSTGVWSGGKGKFLPDSTNLQATYNPSSTEVAAGSVKLTLKSTNNGKCLQEQNSVTFTFTPVPQIEAGSPLAVCENNAKAKLNASVVPSSFGVKWSGGKGSFIPNDTTADAVYELSADEISAGQAVLTASTKNNGNCSVVNDNITISIIRAPAVIRDTITSVCSNNPQIKLSATSFVGSGTWQSPTGGQFTPRNTDINATYTATEQDVANGSVTLSLLNKNSGACGSIANTFTAVFAPKPIVNAGMNQTLCANNPNIRLTGSVSGASSTGIWSGGSNNFPSGNTNLTGTYVPTPQEILNGKVLLTLSSTGNSTCTPVADTVTFYFSPSPVINAGGDKTVCGDLAPVKMNGTASAQITSVLWKTDGSGVFDNATSLTAIYKPTLTDQDKNSVKLTLTSTAQGNCKPVEQSLNIVFTQKPVAKAGPDLIFCTSDSIVQLAATGSPGTWSTTAGGSFMPSAEIQNAKYKPTASAITSGTITLRYTTQASGPCPSVSDEVLVKVLTGPVTTATIPPVICSDQLIPVSAPKVSANRIRWSSTGSGSFSPSDTAHSANYKPSQTEIKNGSVQITLEVKSAQCGSARKTFDIKVLPKFEVMAGDRMEFCSDIKAIPLSGNRSGQFPVKWTSNGTGTFSPSDTSLISSYIPAKADLDRSGFQLTLSSNGTSCPNTSSTINVGIRPAPQVDAGENLIICNDTSGVSLNGVLLNSIPAGGFWTTNAGGTFNPNGLSAKYIPKNGEKGLFKFYLTSTGNGICNAARDSMTLTINDRPVIEAIADGKICADEDTVNLKVKSLNSSGIIWSKIQGGGTISSVSDTNAFYIISASDRLSGFVSFRVKSVQGTDKCKAVEDRVVFDITPATTVKGGGDVSYCENSVSIPLNANITGATGVSWRTLGSGTFSNGSALSTTYKPSAQDAAEGQVDIVVTALATNICKAKNDTVRITLTPQPSVTVPTDLQICADSAFVQLEGNSSTGSGVWSTDGGNNFSPNATSQIVKFVPSPADISKGVVNFLFTSRNNGSCAPVSKPVILNITPAPTVNAGLDQEVCADITSVTLTGNTSTGGGSWTSSGTGTFTSSGTVTGTALSDNYIFSVNDTIARQVTLTLTSANNGQCKQVSDQVVIRILPAPFIESGNDTITQCGDKPSIDLSGIFGNTRNARWSSSGAGKFAPNDTSSIASYLITEADKQAGLVNIFYSTIGTGKCKVYNDTLVLNITPAPVVTVSGNREVCAEKDTIFLSGTKLNSQGVLWTGSGKGIFSPRRDTTNIVYKITQEDRRVGTVKFKMQATGIGTCKVVSDSLTVSIAPSPTANAGKSEAFCASVNEIDLTGSVTISAGGVWKTSGTGTFSDTSDLYAKYFPSATDKQMKSVELTLSTSGNGLCSSTSSKVVYTFSPIPEVTIGSDQTVCKDVERIPLNGSYKNAQGGYWVPVGGKGTFSPDNSQSITAYVFDSADVKTDVMLFNYISFGNGVCEPVSKTLTVKFLPTPVVDAGSATGICSDAPSIQLNGTIQNAGGAEWKSAGSGSLVSSGQGLQATYIPTQSDINNGSVRFYLTSKNNNGCKAYADSINVEILPAPVISSIPSHTICADSSGIFITPVLTGNVGSVLWSTGSGTGNFAPSNTTESVTFTPSSTQINNGKATVTLLVKGGGVCANSEAKATSTIDITPAPVLTLSDVSVCEGSTTVELNAVQNNNIATDFQWTSLSTDKGIFTNANSLNTTYNTSAAEQGLINGSVKVLFETTNQGNCKAFRDTISINFVATPPVSAGLDQTICTNVDSVRLMAIGSVGTWSKIGAGAVGTFEPNANSLNASYFPSPDDRVNNKVSLVFTSTPGGSCTQKSDTVDITINEGPTFNPGGSLTTCANSDPVALNANNSPNSKVTWVADGTGIFSDSLSAITTYTPSLSDVNAQNISIRVKLIDNSEICKPEYKNLNIRITPSPKVYSGSDFDVCGNAQSISVTGKISQASVGAGKWTILSPVPGKFKSTDNSESTFLTDEYIPSVQEKGSSMATLLFTSNNNGLCKPVSDTLIIRFTGSPIVEAGSVVAPLCGDTAYVPLNGSVSVVNGGQWTHNGLGSFTDTNQVITRYVPNEDERVNGAKVKFILTSYSLGTCLSEKDSIELEITPMPVINAGLESSVCADTSFIQLNGSVQNVAGGRWSIQRGTGRFSSTGSNITDLLTDRYIPSDSDIASGQIYLKLTTTGVGNCKPLDDFKRIVLTPAPAINAGPDFSVCSNNRLLDLEASILRVATGIIWNTTGTGSFISKKDSLITSYMPSSQDSLSESVIFVLSSTGNGACKPAVDSLKVRLTSAPVVTVSDPLRICADSNAVILAGKVTGGATSGIWTSTGAGIISNPTAMRTPYRVSAADIITGNVVFTLTSDNNGNCLPQSKTVRLDIDPRPVIFAGNDTTVCSDNKLIKLTGTKNSVITATKWSTTATPGFKSPVTDMVVDFEPNPTDVKKGAIMFVFESTSQGLCKPVRDVKVLNFQEAPVVTVNAGLPKTICANNSVIQLNGKVMNANRSTWSSLTPVLANRGQFEDSMKVNTVYQPSATELGNGADSSRITLRLTGFNSVGKCTSKATSDVEIIILPEPVIEFNAPQDTVIVCADKDTVYVSAFAKLSGKIVPGFWESSGNGVFETNSFISNPVYRLSDEDRRRGEIAIIFKSDGNIGCDTISKVKIIKLIPSLPTADAGPDQEICKNNPVISLEGAITVASISGWHASLPVSNILPDSNNLSVTVVPTQGNLDAGALKMRLFTHGPSTCNDVMDEMMITFTEAPVVEIPATSMDICADNDSVQLTATINHAEGGLWRTNGTGRFIPSETSVNAVYSPSEEDKTAGVVVLKLISIGNRNCEEVSDSVQLNIRQAPIVSASAESSCVTQNGISLKGNSSTGAGEWISTGSGSFSPNPKDSLARYIPGFDDFTTGQVQLSFQSSDNKTCRPVAQLVTVNVSPVPVADAGKDQKICIGTSTQLTALVTPNVNRYSWSELPSNAALTENIVLATPVLTADANYKLEVTDVRGCKNMDTVFVRMMQVPTLAYSSPYCALQYIRPTQMPADTSEGIFQWFRNEDLLSLENKSSIIPNQMGMYTNIFSAYNCSVNANTVVKPVPAISGINKIICANTTSRVEMNVVPNNTGYDWTFRTFGKPGINTVSDRSNFLDINAGTDTLVYYATVKDTSSCSATDSIIVYPVPKPIYRKLPDTTLCNGISFILDGTPVNFINNRLTYLWTPGGDTTAQKSIIARVNDQQPDTALYAVTVSLGECIQKDTAVIYTNPSPAPGFPDRQVFCNDGDPNLPVPGYMLDAGSPGATYQWSNGDTTRIIKVTEEGKYKVRVINKYKCEGSDSILLIEKCQPRVFRPEAFTPNGDGKNDVFRVFGNKFVKNFKLLIFNRWGEVIYSLEDIPGDNVFETGNKVYAWDGTYRGEEMPLGSYPYIINYEGKEEEFKGPYQLNGSITLIR